MKQSVFICIILFLIFGGISFAQGEAQEAEDLYLAKRAFNDGFYEIALKHFRKYIQESPEGPDDSELQIFISRCYLELEKYSQALHTLQKVLDKSDSTLCAPALYWTAQTYLAARDYESAQDDFTKIIEQYPGSQYLAQSFYYRASCYYKRRQFKQALDAFQDFNKKFSRHELKEKSLFHLAQCFYNVKDYSGAYKQFKLFLKNFSQSADRNYALFYLGEIEYIRGNYDKAIQFYAEAARLQPELEIAALARYAMGWVYLKLKEYQKALEEFNKLGETPGFARALEDSIIFARARSQGCLQNYAAALRLYERIINAYPHSSWFDDAYFWKGQALYELGRYQEACRTYEEAIEKFAQGRPQAKKEEEYSAIHQREDSSVNLVDNLRYNLGWAYARMKRYTQAIEQFKKVFEDSRERFLKSGALSRIGDIYLEQAIYDEAIEHYDSVLTDFSDTYYADYAQYQLGVVFAREKKFDSAIVAFNALIANFSQSKFLDQAHYQKGLIYFREGRFAQAGEQMQSLIKEFPQSQLKAEATFLLASIYYNAQDYARAQDAFCNVLRMSADDRLKMKAQYQIGFCFYQMGKEEKAIKEFKRFLSLYEDSELCCDVLFWLGQFYFRQKRFTKAEEYFAVTLERFPHNELADDVGFWQAKASFEQGKPTIALEQLESLQTKFPNSGIIADVVLLKGDIFKEQGEITRAEDSYKEVCARFKETDFARLAHKKRADILEEQDLFPEAIKQYRQALGSCSDNFNAQAQFDIARCREEQEDLTQALDEYLKVVYLYPGASNWARKAQLKSARILERQAQWKRAKTIYEQLTRKDCPEAEFARKRLKELEKHSPCKTP